VDDFLSLFILEVILINARTNFWCGSTPSRWRRQRPRITDWKDGVEPHRSNRRRMRSTCSIPRCSTGTRNCGVSIEAGRSAIKDVKNPADERAKGAEAAMGNAKTEAASIAGPPRHQPSTTSPARNSIALPVFRLFDRLGCETDHVEFVEDVWDLQEYEVKIVETRPGLR
jgi:hypothetical protein